MKSTLLLSCIIIILFFTCEPEQIIPKLVPTVTTKEITGKTASSAQSGGTIISDGGKIIATQGICWSKNVLPTTNDNKKLVDAGNKDYTSIFENLSPATKYYVRAFATNSIGMGYGNQVDFVTLKDIPVVITNAKVSLITTTSAQSGGVAVSDGGDAITSRGVCYSIFPKPTTANSFVTSGNGIGTFTCTLGNLLPLTKYYIRAYAINSVGTAYGEEIVFYTLDAVDQSNRKFSIVGPAFYKTGTTVKADWNYDIDFIHVSKILNRYTFEIRSVMLLKDGEFKIRENHDWVISSYGYSDITIEGDINNFFGKEGGININVRAEKTYKLVFNANWVENKFSLVCTPL